MKTWWQIILASGRLQPTVVNSPQSVSILFENDLRSDQPGALLLHEPVSHAKAALECHRLDESLLTDVTDDVFYQLQYYAEVTGTVAAHLPLWVANDATSSKFRFQTCLAWSISEQKIVDIPCESNLPALCTHTAPISTGYERCHSHVTVTSHNLTITGYAFARYLSYPTTDD